METMGGNDAYAIDHSWCIKMILIGVYIYE
jgi:hypothetical protein